MSAFSLIWDFIVLEPSINMSLEDVLAVGATYEIMTTRVLIAVLGGVAGSLFDSLLGATVQAIYFCPTCQKETEQKLHTCGTPTTIKRGWRWLNNDWVNFISSLFGAAVAVGPLVLRNLLCCG
jgi:uncharacterized membrane protein